MGNIGSAHPLVEVNVSYKFEGNPSISKGVIERHDIMCNICLFNIYTFGTGHQSGHNHTLYGNKECRRGIKRKQENFTRDTGNGFLKT